MHLTNTAINIENSDEPPSAFTKLATEVLHELEVIDERATGLWARICHACCAVLVALYPTLLHNLPKKCDQRQPIVVQKGGFFSQRRDRHPPLIDMPEPTFRGPAIPPLGRSAPQAPDVVCHQTNMLIVPHRTVRGPAADPVVVGSIVHYQIQPAQPRMPPLMRQQLLLATRRRSVSPVRRLPSPPPARLPPILDEDEPAGPEAEPQPEIPPLKLTKRYFHILGIDIMIDSEMNPQVLELNDRPSLGVTVDFESDLKQSVIADAFEHVLPDGEVRGDSPATSHWRKIFPVPGTPGRIWRAAIDRVMHPLQRIGEQQPKSQAPLQLISTKSRIEERPKRKQKKSADRSSG